VVVNYIPSTQVLAIVKQRLQISTSNFDAFLDLELQFLLNKMYSPSLYGDYEATVEVCDGAFLPPKGAKRLWGIQLCEKQQDNTFLDITNGFYPLLSAVSNNIPVYGNNSLKDFVQQQDGFYKFNTLLDELYVKVWYEGFGVDKDGFLLIPEHYQDFLGDGLCYRFLLSHPTYYKDVNLTLRLEGKYKREYKAKKKQINGEDQVLKFREQASLLRFATSKIRMNSPYWSNYNNI